MNIDFSKIEETCTPNFKGGEKYYAARRYEDGLNRITKGRLVPGASIGLHNARGQQRDHVLHRWLRLCRL